MEIADIFVLNKADTPGAQKVEIQLKAMLELGLKDKDLPPVIKTVATEGKGTDELVQAVFNLSAKKERDDLAARRKKLIAWMLRDITQEKLYGLINKAVKDAEFERYVEKIFSRKIDPYTAADEIVARLTVKRPKEKR
jgi:LAO/AO transport system kinase